jgi:hypothetical protein
MRIARPLFGNTWHRAPKLAVGSPAAYPIGWTTDQLSRGVGRPLCPVQADSDKNTRLALRLHQFDPVPKWIVGV